MKRETTRARELVRMVSGSEAEILTFFRVSEEPLSRACEVDELFPRACESAETVCTFVEVVCMSCLSASGHECLLCNMENSPTLLGLLHTNSMYNVVFSKEPLPNCFLLWQIPYSGPIGRFVSSYCFNEPVGWFRRWPCLLLVNRLPSFSEHSCCCRAHLNIVSQKLLDFGPVD